MLGDRLKHVIPIAAHDCDQFISKIIYKKDYEDGADCSYRHNHEFIQEAMDLFKLMGEKNRFRMFARVRYHHDLSGQFISTRPTNISLPDT